MRARTHRALWLAICLLAPPAGAVDLLAVDGDESLYSVSTEGYGVTLVGAMNITPSPFSIQALAFNPSGTLYGLFLGPEATLYRIDPASAEAAAVADLGTDFRLEGALAFDPVTATMVAVNETSIDQSRLVTLDLDTGQAAPIGRIAGGVHDFAGLAFDTAGILYGLDSHTNALWIIDRDDPFGSNTRQVGPGLGSGIAMGSAGGMTYDSASGTYYGYAQGSRQMFTVDLQTGLGTVVHTFGPGDPEFLGLAFSGEIPTAARSVSWSRLKSR